MSKSATPESTYASARNISKEATSNLPFIRSANNYNTNLVSDDTGLDASFETSKALNPDSKAPHQAQQSFTDENNIVNLVDKLVNYGVGREMPVPISGNFTNATDFHTAMNHVVQAEREFNELPAHIRARFQNDAGLFLDFFNDPKNSEEAAKLGFLAPKVPDQVLKVDVVDTVDRRASKALKKAKEEAGEE